MKKAGTPTIFILISLLLVPYLKGQQQQPDIRDRIVRQGLQKIRLAIPDFASSDATASNILAAKNLHQVIWDDLEFSGLFQLIEQSYYRYVGETNPEKINFEDWSSIGAEALLIGNAAIEQGKIVMEARLFHIKSKQMMVGKRYRAEPENLRMIAHTFADEIVLSYTGQRGIANTQIVFTSDRSGSKEIFIMDYDGHNQRKITELKSYSIFPDISPDGNSIVFTSYFRGYPDLHLLNRKGGKLIQLTAKQGLNTTPDWSPDGKKLVFTSSRDGNAELYIIDRNGSNPYRLTRNHCIDTSPCWSSTGREIAFTSDKSGTPQIYIIDAEGTNLRRVTHQGNYNDCADWSNDGLKIAYASRVGGIFDIFLINLLDKSLHRVTINSGSNESPSWAIDSRHLAFASNRSGKYQIYISIADGSQQKQITHHGNNYFPCWAGWK
jgi:TolB protein